MIDGLPAEVPPAACDILTRAWGRPAALGAWEPLNVGKVYRCHPSAGAASVVVKIARRQQSGVVYDPDATAPNPAWRFFGEWAALEFLSDRPGLAPQFYGGHRAAGAIALQDHGPGPRLTEILMGDDPAAARAALLAYAQALGRLHAATFGRAPEYARIRRRLGPEVVQCDAQSWRAMCANLLPELLAGIREAGVLPAPAFGDEYTEALTAVRAAGPFAAFAQCDACPDNCRVDGGAVHLLDFERAGYHHALIDAACAALCFPSCGHALLLPDDVRAAMLHAYRAEITEACPEAGNDRRFGRELACVCAYWLVSNSNWLLREGLSRDETWGFATWRQRIMTRLRLFVPIAQAHLPAMAQTAARCVDRLSHLWPEAAGGLPLYRVFRRP